MADLRILARKGQKNMAKFRIRTRKRPKNMVAYRILTWKLQKIMVNFRILTIKVLNIKSTDLRCQAGSDVTWQFLKRRMGETWKLLKIMVDKTRNLPGQIQQGGTVSMPSKKLNKPTDLRCQAGSDVTWQFLKRSMRETWTLLKIIVDKTRNLPVQKQQSGQGHALIPKSSVLQWKYMRKRENQRALICSVNSSQTLSQQKKWNTHLSDQVEGTKDSSWPTTRNDKYNKLRVQKTVPGHQ